LSSFASGFLLYGIALLFGTTSTGDLTAIRAFLGSHPFDPASGSGPILLASIALLLVGFAFKVSAVPFQAWTPDVYVGAPTPVTAFMSVGTKVAAFAAFARVFVYALHPLINTWQPLVWALAVITMIVGNVLAVSQTNVKRMLAYSSVANAGYMLIAIAIGTQAGVAALLVYLATYAAVNVGAFGALAVIERKGGRGHMLNDLAGLSQREPFVAACFAILLMGLAGIPLLSGFIGKFAVFVAAVQGGHFELALIGALASLLGFYYYLRVIWAMYFTGTPSVPAPIAEPAPTRATAAGAVALAERPAPEAIRATVATGEELRPSPFGRVGLALSVAATLTLGILPFLISGPAATAAKALFPLVSGR
ncbi:MAG TPA: NADH-quinone oxidoreductase subunit N, partial [Ktedonobacterales bacterium]